MKRNTKSMIKSSLIVFFGIFLVTEILLHMLQVPGLQYYRDLKLLHRYHPQYNVALARNADTYIEHFTGLWEGRFRTNSLGLRGTEEPDPSLPKILCSGDSLVMGFGVSDEDTFCALLNGIHITEGNGNVQKHQALNLGVDAYGTVGSAKRLREMAAKIENINELLYFVSPNDYTMPPQLLEQGILPDDVLDEMRRDDPYFKIMFRLQFELTHYSYTLHAIRLGLEQLRFQFSAFRASFAEGLQEARRQPLYYFFNSFYRSDLQKSSEGIANQETENPAEVSENVSETNRERYEQAEFDERRTGRDRSISSDAVCPEPVPEYIECISRPPARDELDPLPDITIEYFHHILETAQIYDFNVRLVLLPMQVEEIYCYQNGMYHPLGNYAYQARYFFEDQGIEVIDMMQYTDQMCQVENGSRNRNVMDHFLPGDGHLTEAGNRWAADNLSEALKGNTD